MKSSSQSSGFTLIELAAAFAVFALILLAVGAMVQQSTVSWREGLDSVSASDEGRAFTDVAYCDLSSAILSRKFPMLVQTDMITMITGHRRYDDNPSDLAEVSFFLISDPDNNSDSGDRKWLVRRQRNTWDGIDRKSYAPSSSKTMDSYTSILAKNVYSLNITATPAPPSEPSRIEISVRILPDETWRRNAKTADPGLVASTTETFYTSAILSQTAN